MHPLQVSPKSIINYAVSRAADPIVMDFYTEFMSRLNYEISPLLSQMNEVMPSWEKVAWRPKSNLVRGELVRGQLKVHPRVMFHEGFHALASEKYGAKLKGRPLFVLLTEAIASCTGLYYNLTYLKKYGRNATESVTILHHYRKFAKILGLSWEQSLREGQEHPYQAFREATLEMFEIYKLLLDQETDPHWHPRRLIERFRNTTVLPWVMEFDYGNNLLFAKANCGLKSSKEDKRITARILADLNGTDNLRDFLSTFA